jgi:hypothetical protein
MIIEPETSTLDNSSHKRIAEAERESLLLERLNGDLSVEFNIEDVRTELAERMKRHKMSDGRRSNT